MTKLFIKISFAAIIVFLIYQCIWLNTLVLNTSYNSFIEEIRILLNKDANWKSFIRSKVSPAHFGLIKIAVVAADFLLLIFLVILFRYNTKILYSAEALVKTICQYIHQDIQLIKLLPKWELTLFVFILVSALIRSAWFACNLAIHYDEAWIYNYFIDNRFIQSFLLPSNNHKLYTSIAWWFNLLPLNKVFLMRLPNILLGLLVCTLFFLLIKKIFSNTTSLIGLAWISSAIPVASFMANAKSYILILLFHILLLRMYYSIYKKTNRVNINFYILTLIVALGYFSNPVFLFGHLFTTLFFISAIFCRKDYTTIRKTVYFNLLALPIIVLLYSPDMISGSFAALVKFAVTQKINIQNFFLLCIKNNADFQTGFIYALVIFTVILILAATLLFKKGLNNKAVLLYAISSIAWLPLYAEIVKDDTSVHKTIYITISFALILLFIYQNSLGKIFTTLSIVWAACIAIIYGNFILVQKNSWFNWSHAIDNSVKTVSRTLLQNEAQSCYLSAFYYKPGLEFNFRVHKKPLKIFMGVPGSVDYAENVPENPKPDYLIIDRQLSNKFSLPKSYETVYTDRFVIVYELKK